MGVPGCGNAERGYPFRANEGRRGADGEPTGTRNWSSAGAVLGDDRGRGPSDVRKGCPGGLGRRAPRRRRGRGSRGSRGLRGRRRAGPSRAPPAGEVRHRTRDRRDDGEPQLRPLPRLAAPRRRQAGGPVVRRSAGHAAVHVPSDPVQRLRLHRPRPLLLGGSPAVQRRQDGRLPLGHRQRHLRHRVLHGQGPPLHEQARPVLHDVRPLLLLHPGPDLSQPLLPARRADRPPRRCVHQVDPAHHLGPAQSPGRADGSLLLQRRAVRRPLGRHLHVNFVPLLRIPPECSHRPASQRVLPRPQVRRRGRRDLGRRSPPRRHPRR